MIVTVIILAVAALVVFRQFQARTVRPGPLVAIPLALVGLGCQSLLTQPPSGGRTISFLAANIVISVALGAWRGRTERIWRTADGATWRQGTAVTMALWIVSIAARVVTIPVGHAFGAHAVAGSEIELMLGLSLAAQHLVIANRAGPLRAPCAAIASTN
jgi:hypothetical protein